MKERTEEEFIAEIAKIDCKIEKRGWVYEKELEPLRKARVIRVAHLLLLKRGVKRTIVLPQDRGRILAMAYKIFWQKRRRYPMLTYKDLSAFLRLQCCFVRENNHEAEIAYVTLHNKVRAMFDAQVEFPY